LARDELEVGGPEELRADEDGEDRAHEDQPQQGAGAGHDLARLHAALPAPAPSAAPVAAIMRACSSHSVAGRGSPRRPRHMTAMRSQSPSSSARSLLATSTALGTSASPAGATRPSTSA